MIEVYRLIKRVVDFCLSLIFFIVFSPVILFLSTYMLVSAGRPIIFKAERVGKDKKIFTVYKFRTLVNGIERRKDGLSPQVVINNVAAFMRDTHLDEVLQLFNVIKGDMALIGPRPLDVPRYEHLKSLDPSWDEIFRVKPGMTCINQIAKYSPWGMGKARKLKGLENAEKRNRLMLDRYYIQNESVLLDIRIVLWTMRYLVLGFFKKMFKKGECYN